MRQKYLPLIEYKSNKLLFYDRKYFYLLIIAIFLKQISLYLHLVLGHTATEYMAKYIMVFLVLSEHNKSGYGRLYIYDINETTGAQMVLIFRNGKLDCIIRKIKYKCVR